MSIESMFVQVLNCEAKGLQCEWIEESVPHVDCEYYGSGTMKQRRCPKCQTIEYIEFTSKDGYVTEITVLKDEEFEKLCEYLENPPEPTEAFLKAAKAYKEKYKV